MLPTSFLEGFRLHHDLTKHQQVWPMPWREQLALEMQLAFEILLRNCPEIVSVFGNRVRRTGYDDPIGLIAINHQALDRAHLYDWAKQLNLAESLKAVWNEATDAI